MPVDSIAFSIGSIDISYRGALIAASMILGMIICTRDEKWLGLPDGTMLTLGLIAVPCALLFSRVFFAILSSDSLNAQNVSAIDLFSGGFSLFGAVFGGVIAIFSYVKFTKLPIGRLAEACAAPVALCIAIGRWGDYFNQESFGPLVENKVFQVFPVAQYIDSLGEWHYSLFYYESFACILIFAYLIGRRGQFKRKGDSMLMLMLLYGALRCFLESCREDSLFLGFVRISQIFSLLLALSAVIAFSVRALKNRPLDGQDIACYVSVAMIVATAIICEFYMSHDSMFINRTLLGLSMIALVAAGTLSYRRIEEVREDSSLFT